MFYFGKKKKFKSIYDLSNLEFSTDLSYDRKKFKILIIDDEGFNQDQKDYLVSLGYKDIDVEYDYEKMEKYVPYDIILCDINGVAKSLNQTFQGAALAKKIKTTYSDKIVALFSAAEYDLSFVPYYASVDDIFVKNISLDQLSEKLDNYIKMLKDPCYKWKNIK